MQVWSGVGHSQGPRWTPRGGFLKTPGILPSTPRSSLAAPRAWRSLGFFFWFFVSLLGGGWAWLAGEGAGIWAAAAGLRLWGWFSSSSWSSPPAWASA
jgi:hypothetical protein